MHDPSTFSLLILVLFGEQATGVLISGGFFMNESFIHFVKQLDRQQTDVYETLWNIYDGAYLWVIL